ncbi:hypothetical protein ACQ4M3_39170 [Leptolyngbya sp. AN03gr2]|uniref:hypothetical protein n=1 Tax=Leptolyngbya sp. AN03gr2 TaxID=3423364 RepID=UPI003D32005D
MPDVHIIAPLPSLRRRARLAKMVPIFLSNGYKVYLHGWDRQAGDCARFRWGDPRVNERPILVGGGYGTRRAQSMYLVWMIVVFFKVLRLKRGSLCFCLGWESAFPAQLASKLRPMTIVFDDADRFSMIIRLPGLLGALLERLEQWTSHHAKLHLVPGLSRYDWHCPAMRLLRNTPTTADFEHGRQSRPLHREAAFCIYVNGWVGSTRGAPVFHELMVALAERAPDVLMVIAGRIDCPDGEALIRLPNVEYLGQVDLAQSLGLYHACDVVLTFYDPSIVINRHAESNKWGDCVFVGVPFIVNSEVETAAEFVARGAAWSVEYHNWQALTELIVDIASRPQEISERKHNLSTFRREYLPFDEQFQMIIDEIQSVGGAP